jgi:hypothetical protein
LRTDERDAIRQGLDALKPYLAAFVSQHARGGARHAGNDTAALLKTLIDEWNGTFQSCLPPVARSYVHELRDIRNRWAHEASFTEDETARAIDTMRQLAALIGAPSLLADQKPKQRLSPTPPLAEPAHPRGWNQQWSGQRETMRKIYLRWKGDSERVVREYAAAERAGQVQRKRNKSGYSPEEYARALLADGHKKGWLKQNG